ncbi:MAG: four helix bundle protein [Candidatus Absconditabacterales bacterium]
MEYGIHERALDFAIDISKQYIILKNKRYYEIASQVFRSGTSIGANVSEAQSGCSKKDFINKMNISLKEARETMYRLRVLQKGFNEPNRELQEKCEIIIKILITIIKRTKENNQKQN